MFLAPDGRRLPGRIAIGLPKTVDDHGWCDLALEPLIPGVRHTFGEGKLQALVAALRLVGSQIDDFLRRGGRLLEPGSADDPDTDFAIDAVLGPLLGPRGAPPEG